MFGPSFSIGQRVMCPHARCQGHFGTYLPLEQADHTAALFQQAQLCIAMPPSGKAMAGGLWLR